MSNEIYTKDEKIMLMVFGILASITCGLSFIIRVSANPVDFMLALTLGAFGMFLGSYHSRIQTENKDDSEKKNFE